MLKPRRLLRINFDKMIDETVDENDKCEGKRLRRRSKKSQLVSSGVLEILPYVAPKRGRGRPKGSSNRKPAEDAPAASAPTENVASMSLLTL